MHMNNNALLITVLAQASRLVVQRTVVVGTVIKRVVPLLARPTTPLVGEVVVETRERTMLSAFVLKEQWALRRPEIS